MKDKLMIFLFILLSTIINAQAKDTIFLKKDKFQKIFIDKNKNSEYYKLIADFTGFNISKDSLKIKQQSLHIKWMQIYNYKGGYYLYSPCDQINDLKYVINNNEIQVKSSEIITYKIVSLKKRKQSIYIKYQQPNSNKQIFLTIKPISEEKGIYKFITSNDNEKNEKIMLLADRYKNYNLIVNECTNNKSIELDFNK